MFHIHVIWNQPPAVCNFAAKKFLKYTFILNAVKTLTGKTIIVCRSYTALSDLRFIIFMLVVNNVNIVPQVLPCPLAVLSWPSIGELSL